MFHAKHPLAWTFHRQTSYTPRDVQTPVAIPREAPPFKEYPGALHVALPAAQFPATTLEAALAARLTCRRFVDAPLPLAALATLLQAAYGVVGPVRLDATPAAERPVPSGGGLYPLELYLMVQRVAGLAPALYHYAPVGHALEQLSRAAPDPVRVADLFLHQPYLAGAAVVVVLAGVAERSLWKYGDRGYRYLLFEAGHVAQNLNLTAAALGLGSANLGGFFDMVAARLFGLDFEDEVPLYGIALGVPAEGDRLTLRRPPEEDAAPAPPAREQEMSNK